MPTLTEEPTPAEIQFAIDTIRRLCVAGGTGGRYLYINDVFLIAAIGDKGKKLAIAAVDGLKRLEKGST